MDQYALVGSKVGEEPARFLAGAFLHGDIVHFIMNVTALLFLGSMVEQVFGRVSFLVVYAASMIVGQVAVLLWTAPEVATVGASGAIYGLFGAALVANLVTRSWLAAFNSIVVISVNAVLSFVTPGISWQAHLGGLIAGVAVAIPCAWMIISWARRRAARQEEKFARYGQGVPQL